MQAFVDQMRADGLAPSTVLNRLDVLRVLYRRATRDERVKDDPTENLEIPAVRSKRRKIAAVDRSAELLAALPDSERAVWATMVYAGLRRGEVRALRWSHVELDRGVIAVVASWDDKHGEQEPKSYAGTRRVPIASALRSELLDHRMRTGRNGDDLVFGRTPSLPFIPTTIRHRARAAWAAAGLTPMTPHEARHTCASYLIAAGLIPKQAQTYIGHSDVKTTFNVYGHLLPGDEAAAALALVQLIATSGGSPRTGLRRTRRGAPLRRSPRGPADRRGAGSVRGSARSTGQEPAIRRAR